MLAIAAMSCFVWSVSSSKKVYKRNHVQAFREHVSPLTVRLRTMSSEDRFGSKLELGTVTS